MAEGIILFSGDNVWTQSLDRTKKYWLHGILLGISIAAVTAGIGCEIYRKNVNGNSHFVSDHAITGIACYAIGIASLCLGYYIGAFRRLVTETEQQAVLGVTIIIAVWSLLAAFKSGYNQLKNVFVK
ncbi:hypothetical protein NQ314_018223 [Rhamnusium bicolor]|uniref:ascorbate ferrireductase (transmembrane) n=1 Tax=Rhamnusium bicolor TaxID=1586634 RepID=A0AAV8WQW8_9CUCU|nr:hypothetical protein NQ314_018223 [Rhamnusium bicolor]